jgi:hypothetical protein
LIEQPQNMTAQIKYKNIEETFVGKPEQVWLSLNKLFKEFVPAFDIANQLVLKVDVQGLAKDCEGIISFSEEGANLMIPRSKLTDNETLTLWLLAKYLGKELNLSKSAAVSKEELQAKLGKGSKILSTRIGELIKSEIASKADYESYKITSFGIVQVQNDILPRVKTKSSQYKK